MQPAILKGLGLKVPGEIKSRRTKITTALNKTTARSESTLQNVDINKSKKNDSNNPYKEVENSVDLYYNAPLDTGKKGG